MEGKFQICTEYSVRGIKIELETRTNNAEHNIMETVKTIFQQEDDMAKKECKNCHEIKSLIKDSLCYKCFEIVNGKKYKPEGHRGTKGKGIKKDKKQVMDVKSTGSSISIPIELDYEKLAEKIAPIVTEMIIKRISTKQIIFEVK